MLHVFIGVCLKQYNITLSKTRTARLMLLYQIKNTETKDQRHVLTC